ncbi:MAG: hypothetical protein Q9218_005683 [Villophora microphyllina]
MKRKRETVVAQEGTPDTSKPTAVFEASGGRAYTVSVALPGSIISKYEDPCLPKTLLTDHPFSAQSPELKTLLVGRIARALAVFCVDEVVIFDDGQSKQRKGDGRNTQNRDDRFTGNSDPNYFMLYVLSYLETPPFLRSHLFPTHPDLQYAGILPSLDMPHHLRSDDWCQYREGVTVEQVAADQSQKKKKKKQGKDDSGFGGTTLVDVGLQQKFSIPAIIPPKTRVTVKLPENMDSLTDNYNALMASAVPPSEPREQAGYYWGYTIRAASSLSAVITECTYSGGYDLTFGTSERGTSLSELTGHSKETTVPEFKHMLIVFGGVAGLEVAVKADTELQKMGVEEPKDLFDYWVNLCPGQGSRTIRTEEAVWLGLMGLREVVLSKGKR